MIGMSWTGRSLPLGRSNAALPDVFRALPKGELCEFMPHHLGMEGDFQLKHGMDCPFLMFEEAEGTSGALQFARTGGGRNEKGRGGEQVLCRVDGGEADAGSDREDKAACVGEQELRDVDVFVRDGPARGVHLRDGDVAVEANIDIGPGRRSASQVIVAREIQAGLFFVPVIQRERFRIERTPNDLGVRRAGGQEGTLTL